MSGQMRMADTVCLAFSKCSANKHSREKPATVGMSATANIDRRRCQQSVERQL